jgi:radical SAM protein with 4Fe4S-binding SPASM domain
MYYKLKEGCRIRGWERLPHSIQDTRTGNTSFLDEIAFQAVSFCNGSIDIDSPLVLPVHRETIIKLKESGVIEECSYGDGLMQEQEYRLIPCRFIRRAHWSITGKCNLKCRHCYMSAPQAKYGELSREQCLDIVRQISDAGILQVSLTGGEPLVRQDFLEIVDALLERKIAIRQIYTNGVLVNEKLLADLETRNTKPEFSLSFDGVGWHDWLRGVDGAEKLAIDAIKLLRSHSFPVSIETSLHKGNIHTLETTFNLLVELGVRGWKTSPTSDAGNWLNEAGKYNLKVDELYTAYMDFIPKYKAAGAPLSIMLGGFFMCNKGSEKYQIPSKKFDGSEKMLRQTICPSARNTMYIAADGKLLPCIPLTGLPIQESMPSVTEMEICQALSDSRYLNLIDTRLEDLLRVNTKCRGCEYRLYCGGGCRAGALVCSGEYLGCDDYTCYFFKNKYEDRIASLYEKG